MRIESCRKCGTEMIPCTQCETCSVCNEPMNLYCPKCKTSTENQIHLHNFC